MESFYKGMTKVEANRLLKSWWGLMFGCAFMGLSTAGVLWFSINRLITSSVVPYVDIAAIGYSLLMSITVVLVIKRVTVSLWLFRILCLPFMLQFPIGTLIGGALIYASFGAVKMFEDKSIIVADLRAALLQEGS